MYTNITQNMKALRLGGMTEALPSRYQEAKANELDYLDFLQNLINDELTKRKDSLLNRRLKISRLPEFKSFDDFDWAFNSSINKKLVMELATSRFIHQSENVLFIGPPGVGKSHLCNAIALCAIHNGLTVFYTNAFDLVDEMAEAFRTDSRKKYVSNLIRQDLLIIDEFGMKQMPKTAAEDILEVIHRRYNHSSTIITTNRPLEDWGKILGDNAATSAILDRFLDKAKVVNIKGKSYRMRSQNKLD
jgi:DNA replication protein DnaC